MTIELTTTGTPATVALDDLGIVLTHPETDYLIYDSFSSTNQWDLDAIRNGDIEAARVAGEITVKVDGVVISVPISTAIVTATEGGGDMSKSTYDVADNGVVDDSDKLGNQLPAYYLDTDNHTDGATNKVYTGTEKTKLTGIETAATADQTDAEIKTAYENNTNTNAFTDTEQTKLTGIESGAEVNVQSDWSAVSGDALILNKPTDLTDLSTHNVTELSDVTDAGSGVIITSAERTKLGGIEALADVTDSTNVDAAGAVMEADTSTASMSFVLDEDAMGSDSATKLATQQSIKAYVDSQTAAASAGIDLKDPVDTCTYSLGNITLSGEQTLNGLLTSTSRVIVTEQTNGEDNGIYVTAAGAWSRSTDADTSAEVTKGMQTTVLNTGSLCHRDVFKLITDNPITLDTTPLSFTRFQAADFGTTAGTYAEGNDSRFHDAVTLNADAPTQDGANLSGQEIQLVLATATNHGLIDKADQGNIDNLSGTNTGDEPDTSTTVKGIIELATQTEVNTGTDTVRAVTPDTLEDKTYGTFTGTTITDNVVLKTALQELETAVEGVGTGLESKAGNVAIGSFAGNPKTYALTFSTAYADANYSVSLLPVMSNTTNNYVMTISSKTAAGFTISTGANSTSGLLSVDWETTKHGED